MTTVTSVKLRAIVTPRLRATAKVAPATIAIPVTATSAVQTATTRRVKRVNPVTTVSLANRVKLPHVKVQRKPLNSARANRHNSAASPANPVKLPRVKTVTSRNPAKCATCAPTRRANSN